jgi:hypothetical protein
VVEVGPAEVEVFGFVLHGKEKVASVGMLLELVAAGDTGLFEFRGGWIFRIVVRHA